MTFFSAEDLDAFERDGYAVVRGLFNGATLDQVLHWTEEVRNAPEIPGQPPMLYFEDSVDEPKRRILSRAKNLSEHNQGFERLFTEGELPARVGELLGEPAVLFKDKMNFKLPGAKGFAPHQDV